VIELVDQWWILLNVVIAGICGLLIGLDRELADKPAGLRTHALVAGAAALVVGIGDSISDSTDFGDPARALHAVITGIGFLGAGVIYTRARHDRVGGITTAASIFFTAAVGIAIGLGGQILGFMSTIFALVILRLLPILERRLPNANERAPLSDE
jgi:putative Mg2+ transporter-C (MgtC) family protein